MCFQRLYSAVECRANHTLRSFSTSTYFRDDTHLKRKITRFCFHDSTIINFFHCNEGFILSWVWHVDRGNLLLTFSSILTFFKEVQLFPWIITTDVASFERKSKYVWTHIVNKLYSSYTIHIFNCPRAGWILMKLDMDEVLMTPYKWCCFLSQMRHFWMLGAGRGKIRRRRALSLKKFFSQDALATNA